MNQRDTSVKSSDQQKQKSNHRQSSKSSSEQITRPRDKSLSGQQNLDPLTKAVEDNLRHSKQREKETAEDKSERAILVKTNNKSGTGTIVKDSSGLLIKKSNNVVNDEDDDNDNNAIITRLDEFNAAKAKAFEFNTAEMSISKIVRELVFHDKVW